MFSNCFDALATVFQFPFTQILFILLTVCSHIYARDMTRVYVASISIPFVGIIEKGKSTVSFELNITNLSRPTTCLSFSRHPNSTEGQQYKITSVRDLGNWFLSNSGRFVSGWVKYGQYGRMFGFGIWVEIHDVIAIARPVFVQINTQITCYRITCLTKGNDKLVLYNAIL